MISKTMEYNFEKKNFFFAKKKQKTNFLFKRNYFQKNKWRKIKKNKIIEKFWQMNFIFY